MIDFAAQLHNELPDDVCWSPYSVASGVQVVARLAADTGLLSLLGNLPVTHPPHFAVAGGLWVREGIDLPARLFADASHARKVINAEVFAATHGLIPDMLGFLGDETTALLVNALYLKSLWRTEFRPIGRKPFQGCDPVPSMRLQSTLGYARLHGWHVVTVAAHDDVEAVVLLPEPSRDLDLEPGLLGTLLAAPWPATVHLTMPKLKLSYGADLLAPLSRIGVRVELPHPGAVVNQVAHQAVLTVDQYGIEGAAATAAVSVGAQPRLGEPVTVVVDRPFHFVVRHARTGAIYFLARVFHPASS